MRFSGSPNNKVQKTQPLIGILFVICAIKLK